MSDEKPADEARRAYSSELVERLAEIEHKRWSHWQRYLHGKGSRQDDGSLLLPASLVVRWTQEFETDYSELDEVQKESDREQVWRSLPDVEAAILANASKRGTRSDGSEMIRAMSDEITHQIAGRGTKVVMRADDGGIVLSDSAGIQPPLRVLLASDKEVYLRDTQDGHQSHIYRQMARWSGKEPLSKEAALANIKAWLDRLS